MVAVLLVEDNPGDARLVREMLRDWDGHPKIGAVHAVDSLAGALAALAAEAFQVVLLDLSLPDSHGLETVSRLRQAAPTIPVVVLSGTDDEEMALKAVKGGAQDYLVKGRGDGETICRAISYAIERFRAEEALRQNEAELRTIFDHAGIGIAVVDGAGCCRKTNPASQAMLGYPAA
ncbi:MAG: response regulator, partial [Rhodospirillales bacterium]|nr:response regulator [Rhodospirillales bacterium]